MTELLISLLTGSATGVLGTLLSAGLGFFQKRQDHRQEIELRRLDIELAQTEAEAAGRIAAIEAESGEQQAAMAALEESYREAARRWSRPDDGWLMQLVDAIRGLTRPGLTLLFVGLTGAIWFTLTPDDADIRQRIVMTVLSLTTTCVVWWFGGRMADKAARRLS